MIQAYDSHCNLVLGDVEETVYIVEEDDEEEIVKVINATESLLRMRLTRAADDQETVRNALRQGSVVFEHYDLASNVKNRRFCSAYFAASSELRLLLLLQINMDTLNFYDWHTAKKRINFSQSNTNKVHETNNTEIQDLSVSGVS